jgi:NTE family protein
MSTTEYAKQLALVLQGGGALGSYQAGVYEAMAEHGYQLDWVAGISIGAINSAIIAGNAPQDRVARLRAFWEQVSSPSASWLDLPLDIWQDTMRRLSGTSALLFGQPGFFRPNLLRCWTTGTLPTSYYDTSDLKETLERLVDFDRINARETRFSIGAVNVRTGNFAYFDNARETIRPEHVMASGALPPGFPAIEIDGEFYWDGGLVSNTHWDRMPLHRGRRPKAIGEAVRYYLRPGSQYHREAVVRMYERSRTCRSAARFDALLRVWRRFVLRSFEESGRPPHRKPDAISKSRRYTDGFPLTLTF